MSRVLKRLENIICVLSVLLGLLGVVNVYTPISITPYIFLGVFVVIVVLGLIYGIMEGLVDE